MEYLYYILALVLGIIGQKLKKINSIILFISYILSVCISNDILLNLIADYTKLDTTVIIIICVIFYGSSTFSSTAIKSRIIKRMQGRTDYADYMMKIKVQEILENIKYDIGRLSCLGLKNNEFFVSLFFVKGIIVKKLIRIGYADNLPKIISDRNGVISKPSKTITGRTLNADIISIVQNFDNVDLSGLPKDVRDGQKNT